MAEDRNFKHLLWGFLLILAGFGVFYRIPQAIEKMEQIYSVTLFARFCLYLMGIILVGSGSRKLYIHFRKIDTKD